jgi:serine/threonine protein phosphatase PrpC
MRRSNSEFQTLHISEEGQKLSNRDYFGYVEMDDFACYVLADSLDAEPSVNSARLAVESILRSFTEAPAMRKRTLRKYIIRAHKELLSERGGMHLKASVVVAVTDYRKLCCFHAGNSRLYWIRNARILERTLDHSLTQNLLEQEKIPLDQAAAHEERNNLYSFLGGRKRPQITASRKRKLEDGDMFVLMTRGVWEQCPEQEFLQIANDAKEPKDILEQTEDCVLKKQEEHSIDNYSLAVTFVNKVYQSPKKPVSVKKILMTVLPILLAVSVTITMLYLRHRNNRQKTQEMFRYMDSGEAYIGLNNYQKAAEEYKEAGTLAKKLKRTKQQDEAGQYAKLAEQVILADEALLAGEYQKAQELYSAAREMSIQTGNAGLSYIESQLDRTLGYVHVFDLIAQGEHKEEYGNLEGAVALYKEAKDQSAALYYKEGKEEALRLQMAAEEAMEQQKMEEEARLQEQINEEVASLAVENEQKASDQQSAADMENQGNALLADKMYEEAITFYQTAQSLYKSLGMEDLAERIGQKITAAQAGMEADEEYAARKESEEKAEKREAAREAIRQKEEMEEAVMQAAKEAAKEAVEEAMETETQTETQTQQ